LKVASNETTTTTSSDSVPSKTLSLENVKSFTNELQGMDLTVSEKEVEDRLCFLLFDRKEEANDMPAFLFLEIVKASVAVDSGR
jgi:hypothetical protein